MSRCVNNATQWTKKFIWPMNQMVNKGLLCNDYDAITITAS